jgi:hypothetical protein
MAVDNRLITLLWLSMYLVCLKLGNGEPTFSLQYFLPVALPGFGTFW